ncbi:hypothetical protein NX059_005466 [Plenodomus lindquistii]|nr:hypothetical protein NX059_005466 [Plenodomus lindquistii]
MTSTPDADHNGHHAARSQGQDGAAEDNHEAQGARAHVRIQEDCCNATSQRPILKAGSLGYSASPQIQLSGNRKRLPRARPLPPITYAKTSKQLRSSALFTPQTGKHDENAGHTEDDALRRAIEMSLADQAPTVSPVHSKPHVDAPDDPAPASPRPLSTHTASASSSTAPTAPLKPMIHDMQTTTSRLTHCAEQNWPVNLRTLATSIKEWETALTKLDHGVQAAERNRRRDLDMHLRFDNDMQAKHRLEIASVEQAWRGRLRDVKAEMEQQEERYESALRKQKASFSKELEDQKQIYERDIAQQTVETTSITQASGGRRGRYRLTHALSPSPTTRPQPTNTASSSDTDEKEIITTRKTQTSRDHSSRSPEKRKRDGGGGVCIDARQERSWSPKKNKSK